MARAALRPNPVEIVCLEFGDFAGITALNHRFIPGHQRLKLTIDLNLIERVPGATPALFMAGLERLRPSLKLHSCCGHGRIEETFLNGTRGPACMIREPDDGIDIAHLLEHLIIDFQHDLANMRTCSGITCGHRTPTTRYDLFIETPDERVGRFCVALACSLLNRLLLGGDPSAFCATVLRLARRFFLSAGVSFTSSQTAAALGGDTRAGEALDFLVGAGFVKEIPMAINFSRVPLYGFIATDVRSSDNRS